MPCRGAGRCVLYELLSSIRSIRLFDTQCVSYAVGILKYARHSRAVRRLGRAQRPAATRALVRQHQLSAVDGRGLGARRLGLPESFFGRISGPLSSCRSPQAALN